jgi:hypothetical protein
VAQQRRHVRLAHAIRIRDIMEYLGISSDTRVNCGEVEFDPQVWIGQLGSRARGKTSRAYAMDSAI